MAIVSVSAGLSPSNLMVEGRRFPNLAGDLEGCLDRIPKELEEAGIEVYDFTSDPEKQGEVPFRHFGHLRGWFFHRAWYYWVVARMSSDRSVVLPFEYADPLYQTHGKSVRVGGHCGCPAPREHYSAAHGHLGVETYHVDTQDGLNALADTIRKWSAERAPEAGITAKDCALLGSLGLR